MESILVSIKQLLGLEEDYTSFDSEITMHINSVLMDLTEMGVGPSGGFFIKDKNDVWTDFVSNIERIEAIKSYIYLRVKLLFDPPSSSSYIESINKQITKFEWMINHVAEQGPSEDSHIIAELTKKNAELENVISELHTIIDESGVLIW